jgi:hypothetical protein
MAEPPQKKLTYDAKCKGRFVGLWPIHEEEDPGIARYLSSELFQLVIARNSIA